MADDSPKKAGRMVVEEVSSNTDKPSEASEVLENTKPVEEIKEKVEELQEITEHIGEDVEKSADVQEELAEVAEKVTDKPTSVTDTKSYAPFGQKPKGPSPLIIIIPGILLLGALLGGIYFYQKNLGTSTENLPTTFENSVTPMSQPSSQPSASPSAKLDLTKYSITVQNGSGIPGTAASAKDLLVKGGFKVGTTGNADNYNYTETIVKAKSSVSKEYLTKLRDVLSTSYKVGNTEELPTSSKEEVIVIVGSSKVN